MLLLRKTLDWRVDVKKTISGGDFMIAGAIMRIIGTAKLSDATGQVRQMQASEIIGAVSILCGIAWVVARLLFDKR